MNITLIPDAFLPNTGGLELAVAYLAKELKNRGHHVTIVTGRWPSTLPERDIYEDIEVLRLRFKLPSLNPVQFALFIVFIVLSTIKLCILLQRTKCDVLNIHYIGRNALYGLLAAILSGKRVITSIHGSDITMLARTYIGYRVLGRVVLSRSQSIISNSRDLLNQASQLYGNWVDERGYVVGNGVWLDKFHCQNINKRYHSNKIGAVGRLVHLKGYDLLVRAMEKVIIHHPTAKLIIAGGGPEMKNLTELAAACGIPDSVELLGNISNDDVPAFFTGLAIFVQPSRREAFGISVLEAMAARTPVVATRVGGLPELVADGINGLIIPPEDVEALAEAIVRLLNRPKECAKMGVEGRQIAENNFSWEKVASRYMEILEGA
jgi:glycosyltransferase involved in cell wall biosynthesis